MAQIVKRGDFQWRARIRVKGFPDQSRTFELREDAVKWARATERELETAGFVDRREAESTLLRSVLERYMGEVTPKKKSAEMETVKIRMLLADSVLPKLKMTAINTTTIAAWRDRRAEQVGPSSVIRELGILSAILNHARREWNIHIENPIRDVRRPPTPKARDRRLSAQEEIYLLAALSEPGRNAQGTFKKGGCRNPWLAPLVQLAIETAMRKGEMLTMQWHHVDLERQVAHLPETKNGDARDVPLSTRAVAILQSLPRSKDDHVFPITSMAAKLGFTRAVKRAQAKYQHDQADAGKRASPAFLHDLHFHDLRHEAISRLAEKLTNVLELSAVSGHRDLRMLKRYYHPKAEDLAKKLG